jgi:hypothetical protein
MKNKVQVYSANRRQSDLLYRKDELALGSASVAPFHSDVIFFVFSLCSSKHFKDISINDC